MDWAPTRGSAIRALRPRSGERQPQDLHLGATLGGFAVIVIVALYGKFFVSLITLFFWPAVVAFSVWFFTLGGILLYNLRWDQFRLHKGLHILIGYATAATEHIFLFIIVALDRYLLTPRQA